ncbi:hypothetical protein [Nocardia sp. NPDC050710]|uniref:hypothetical protein n=1 Tax=Nocardia sp. NPDC050710 TaxID=3157220 RepID=UPI0033F29A67
MASLIGQDSTSSGFDPGLQTPPISFGVWGDSGDGDGVIGSSTTGSGVFGRSVDANAAAVRGISLQGTAVDAASSAGTAVHAKSGPAAGGTEAFLASPSHSGDFRGPVRASGPLEVAGSASFGGNVRATGTVEAGAGAFTGNVTTTGALGVSGAGTFGGNVKVTGPLDAGSGSFTGNVKTTGALEVGGNLKAKGSLEATGVGSFASDVHMSGGLDVAGKLGVGITDPTHPLQVARVRGIRQNELYLSGGVGWSSLSYNAFHNSANNNWEFPDPSRKAVTIEMDDNGGTPRFQVWSTTSGNTTGWQPRLMVDGETGVVSIPHSQLSVNNDKPATDFSSANAICAMSTHGNGVFASGGNFAIVASGKSSLGGDTDVRGVLTANDKQFLIDSPADPERKTLSHACVESDERCNVYSGNVVLDDDGTAQVELPDWFCSLNTDFRYQLTCIGQSAPVYVAKEVAANAFSIAGGCAGLKVSWQLTGIRDDAWARANTLRVEREKPAEEQGYYLNPEAFGHDVTRSVYYKRFEALAEQYPHQAEQVLRNFRRGVNAPEDSTGTS